jgi:hypothetical protein
MLNAFVSHLFHMLNAFVSYSFHMLNTSLSLPVGVVLWQSVACINTNLVPEQEAPLDIEAIRARWGMRAQQEKQEHLWFRLEAWHNPLMHRVLGIAPLKALKPNVWKRELAGHTSKQAAKRQRGKSCLAALSYYLPEAQQDALDDLTGLNGTTVEPTLVTRHLWETIGATQLSQLGELRETKARTGEWEPPAHYVGPVADQLPQTCVRRLVALLSADTKLPIRSARTAAESDCMWAVDSDGVAVRMSSEQGDPREVHLRVAYVDGSEGSSGVGGTVGGILLHAMLASAHRLVMTRVYGWIPNCTVGWGKPRVLAELAITMEVCTRLTSESLLIRL